MALLKFETGTLGLCFAVYFRFCQVSEFRAREREQTLVVETVQYIGLVLYIHALVYMLMCMNGAIVSTSAIVCLSLSSH